MEVKEELRVFSEGEAGLVDDIRKYAKDPPFPVRVLCFRYTTGAMTTP
jgi:hypothetical protein